MAGGTLNGHGLSNSSTFRVTQKTVLMMVRPPGLPVMRTGRPLLTTMVGVMELSIRLPGAIWLGGVPVFFIVNVHPSGASYTPLGRAE